MKLDGLLAVFKAVPAGPGKWIAPCPAHEDEHASLSIGIRRDGDGALFHCFVGCELEKILKAKGLTVRDLFFNPRPARARGAQGPTSAAAGCMEGAQSQPVKDRPPPTATGSVEQNATRPRGPQTVAALAEAKLLPLEFLRGLGLEDLPGGGMAMPYLGREGGLLFKRERETHGKRFWQPRGIPLVVYGRERLTHARKLGELWIVEGESDAWTLWYHGLPALGLPGAATAKTLEPEDLLGISTIYVLQEPDKGGPALVRGVVERLRVLEWKGTVLAVRLDGVKDPSDLHVQVDGNRGRFLAALEDAIAEAVALEDLREKGRYSAPAAGFTTQPGGADTKASADSDLAAAREVVAAATEKTKAGDPGAPFERPVLEALRLLSQRAPPEFIRIRSELRKAKVPLGKLDKALAELGRDDKQSPPPPAQHSETVILGSAPETIRRPLCSVAGQSYAAAWLYFETKMEQTVDESTGRVTRHDPPLVRKSHQLLIVRSDGVCFTDAPLKGARPLKDLGLEVALREPVPDEQGWSGAGVMRYLAGERTDPARVFGQLKKHNDYFMDFDCSLAPQETMCDLASCYEIATYLLDAFQVAGYLWSNGEPGSGKTTFLFVVAGVAYLGQVILAAGTYATLRDLADYGATLAFDDAENVMDERRSDPDKRTLLLAGNRRGAKVSLKEPIGDGEWRIRHVETYCPRLFSATRIPDPILGSRAIVVSLVRSADDKKTARSPTDPAVWPHERRRLLDDLWALGLANLSALRRYWDLVAERSRLHGRNLEPWRAILAVALWLQEEYGQEELFSRLEQLSVDYQKRRPGLERDDLTRLLILAVCALATERPGDPVIFTAGEIADRVNAMAIEEDIAAADSEGNGEGAKKFTSPERVAARFRVLGRLEQLPRSGKKRPWSISRAQLSTLLRTHGIAEGPLLDEPSQPSPTVTPSRVSDDGMTVDDGDDSLGEGGPAFSRETLDGSEEPPGGSRESGDEPEEDSEGGS